MAQIDSVDLTMETIVELKQLLSQKDDRIRELEKIVELQQSQLDDMTSKLNKYRTVMASNKPSALGSGGVRQRTTGVSAESGTSLINDDHYTKDVEDVFKTYEKSTSTKTLIEQAIKDNDFLKHLSHDDVNQIADCMYLVDYQADSVIISEGDVGSQLFVIEDGKAEVSKYGRRICTLGPATVFGELAILCNCTRTATVRAVTACKLWAIERPIFQGIIVRMQTQRRRLCMQFLRRVPKFTSFTDEVLSQLLDFLDEVHFDCGHYIVRQSTKTNTFYLVTSGTVNETRFLPSGENEASIVKTLQVGDFFGEHSLDGEEVLNTNFIAADCAGVTCLVINSDTYHQLMTRVDDERRNTRKFVDNGIGIPPKRESVKRGKISLSHLDFIATLGIGGFSRVQLVQLKGDAKLTYALKTLSKHHIVTTHQQDHVFNEKRIMSEARCDFIARLYKTFRDAKYLYMLMEPCLGGEVWTILRDMNYFNESAARFYAGCVIEALVYLHARGIVYRDLKPENMLLDSSGYVKLVDFGFAKKVGVGQKTWTFCGTPEYMAPEVILNRGHDMSADLWSLGILIFELLTGNPLFSGDDPMKTYNLVLKGIEYVDFPKHITKNAKQLIRKLCRENPCDRLGYGKYGLKEVQKHKWYDGFQWDALRHRTLKPPYLKPVKGPADFSNFDSFPDADPNSVPPDDVTGWDEDF